MALARCDEHKPEASGPDYTSYVLPVGYPSTTANCDAVACPNPARLWLTADERAAFLAGARAFVTGRGASFAVAGDLFPD